MLSLSDPAKVRGLARLLAAAQLLILLFMAAGTYGLIARLPHPVSTDFISFYAAGDLAAHGRAADVYDRASHYAAEQRAASPGIDYNFFFYPPTTLLLMAPLSWFPYLVSFALFEAATLLLWLLATARIAGGGSAAVWTLLAVPSAFWTVGMGQNAFLSAGLLALGTLLLRSRPVAAGIAFAALCFKPHFGLLIPVALIAGRHLRATVAAAAALGVFVGASLVLFGAGTWQMFFSKMLFHATIGDGENFLYHVDFYGAARLAGFGAGVSATLQILSVLIAAGVVAALWWRKSAPDEARYAALVAGTLMVAPFALFYDLVIASVAAAWIVRAGRRDGFARFEPAALACLLLVDLATYVTASAFHVSVGMLVAPVLLLMAARRGFRKQGLLF